jgi:hypothetical protein
MKAKKMSLDNCKHCGSPNAKPVVGVATSLQRRIKCINCGMQTQDYSAVEDAIRAWNRKPND